MFKRLLNELQEELWKFSEAFQCVSGLLGGDFRRITEALQGFSGRSRGLVGVLGNFRGLHRLSGKFQRGFKDDSRSI